MEEYPVLAKELLDLPVEILSQIMATSPTSSIKFKKIANAIYAAWRIHRNVPDSLKGINWKEWMKHVRDQGYCETCWAVVTAELVSALLFIKRVNTTYVEYSAQDLLDFVDPEKAKNCKRPNHYCYTNSLGRGLHYVLKEGLEREVDRPYKRCRHASEIPVRTSSGLAHIDGVDKLSFDEGLDKLNTQPIGGSLHIFMPDYKLAKKGLYSGPMFEDSVFVGMHAVSIIAVGEDEETGEKYFLVKSTHGDRVGDEGYLKVSMETMLVQVASDGVDPAGVADDKFLKPKPLITDFRCPTLKEDSPKKCN